MPDLLTASSSGPQASVGQRFANIRAATVKLVAPLSAEDCTVQSMPDASPAKWHLAHTAWFFEQFVLLPHASGYQVFDPEFSYLFNSYYESVGPRHERPHRGLLTRPSLEKVLDFRRHVDEAMERFLSRGIPAALMATVELGLHHEQQHQELLLMDIKHLLWCNPLKPAYIYKECALPTEPAAPLEFHTHPAGIYEIGHSGAGFCFDNESPRHRVYLESFALANRTVTTDEYLAFIRDRGYARAELWLADGWATVQREGWNRPLYWSETLDAQFTLHGMQPLELAAPVCHVSFYEADAFARWSGVRLPSEAEWEIAASAGSSGMFGDVWQWTASAYSPYPGFRPLSGGLSEYNGKFMANQFVLRGGCRVTPQSHIRATYRNFFYPHMRWQFSGIRLARENRL